MAEQRHDLSSDWFPGATLNLAPGSVLVIYTDDGPTGICGQSMDTTCPHACIHWFPNEAAYREFSEKHKLGRSGRRASVRVVVIGEWSAPGKISVIVHEDDK